MMTLFLLLATAFIFYFLGKSEAEYEADARLILMMQSEEWKNITKDGGNDKNN